jgi:hypothetical protein
MRPPGILAGRASVFFCVFLWPIFPVSVANFFRIFLWPEFFVFFRGLNHGEAP